MYFPHTVHYCFSSMLCLSETLWLLLSSSFWEARCALIGQLIQCVVIGRIPQAWDGNVTPFTVLWWHVPGRRNDTKTIKPIIKEAFVASSGDIIIDYNDFYCLFTHSVASHRVNVNMSAFVIGEMTNNKHYSTPLKTRVWIGSGKFIK